MVYDATVRTILKNAITVAAGSAVVSVGGQKSYQAHGSTTASTGAATVSVEGSNNEGATWDVIGTITLTLGTTATSDSFTSADRYARVRGNVTSLTGTGASVNLIMSY